MGTTRGSQSFSRPRSFRKPRTEHLVCILTAAGPGQSPLPTLPGSLSRPLTLQSQAEYFLPAAQLVRREVQTRFILQNLNRLISGDNFPLSPREASRMPLTTFSVIQGPWQHLLSHLASLSSPIIQFSPTQA